MTYNETTTVPIEDNSITIDYFLAKYFGLLLGISAELNSTYTYNITAKSETI